MRYEYAYFAPGDKQAAFLGNKSELMVNEDDIEKKSLEIDELSFKLKKKIRVKPQKKRSKT